MILTLMSGIGESKSWKCPLDLESAKGSKAEVVAAVPKGSKAAESSFALALVFEFADRNGSASADANENGSTAWKGSGNIDMEDEFTPVVSENEFAKLVVLLLNDCCWCCWALFSSSSNFSFSASSALISSKRASPSFGLESPYSLINWVRLFCKAFKCPFRLLALLRLRRLRLN